MCFEDTIVCQTSEEAMGPATRVKTSEEDENEGEGKAMNRKKRKEK